MATLKELRDIRIQKMEKLRKLGVNPYPANSNRTNVIQEVIDNFTDFENKEVTVAGRLMAFRGHGKLSFADLRDESGSIQLYIKEDNMPTEKLSKNNDFLPFSELDLLDIGDFIEGSGKVTKTQRGEISVEVDKIRILAKSLRPLPEKWSGLTDIERRYRRRYLDMTINPEVREVLKKKGLFIQNMREFLLAEGFSEVETPILESVTGGAEANPFITHHNALDIEMYLRISLELPLKRLIAGGMEKVFEIGRVFRNEGMSMMHLQHYTQMEFYWAYADFEMLVDMVVRLYVYTIEKTFGTLKLSWQGTELDFTPPWPRIDYQEAFLKATGIDLGGTYTKEDLIKAAKKANVVDIDESADKGRLIDQIYKKTIRPNIIQPSLLVNHPVIISPLSKRDDKNPKIVQRFQPVMLGAELGNAWSELNDPIDQYERFEEQQKLLEKGDDEAMMMDIDYIEAMEYGMPPNAGFGIGIDRLFMYLADLPSIRDTLFFPIMRPHISEVTKNIYDIKVPPAPVKTTTGYKNLDEKEKRFVAVLNSKVEPGKLMNALGHLSAGMASGLLDAEDIVLVDYTDKEEAQHAVLSHYPFIVLKANNSNQIKALREEAQREGIVFSDFTSTMTVGTTEKQVEETKSKNEEEFDYYALLMFGETKKLQAMTKKFSLFK
ncbi:lysine--tRNA ligase [Candidatus Dojkabacteria bacterium]|uniref:Lysine--tRNA ligase n=1 Tax=Candidatus Dojkabacteria bacterium TaxID=2099670 RepID=A0A955L3S9_9BACT|nr:lysine--tRNA ligase [Candidatus Dojkabacteria bacterium]